MFQIKSNGTNYGVLSGKTPQEAYQNLVNQNSIEYDYDDWDTDGYWDEEGTSVPSFEDCEFTFTDLVTIRLTVKTADGDLDVRFFQGYNVDVVDMAKAVLIDGEELVEIKLFNIFPSDIAMLLFDMWKSDFEFTLNNSSYNDESGQLTLSPEATQSWYNSLGKSFKELDEDSKASLRAKAFYLLKNL